MNLNCLGREEIKDRCVIPGPMTLGLIHIRVLKLSVHLPLSTVMLTGLHPKENNSHCQLYIDRPGTLDTNLS